jgi:hypothetical protein
VAYRFFGGRARSQELGLQLLACRCIVSGLVLDIVPVLLLTVSSLLSQLLSHAMKDASRAKKPVLIILLVVTVVAGVFTIIRLVQKDASYGRTVQDQATLRDTILLERADNGRFREDVRAGMDKLLARRPELKRDTVFVRVHETVREMGSETTVRVTSEAQVEKNPRH